MKILDRIKCKIGWHIPLVWGHAKNKEKDIEAMEKESLGEKINRDKFNPEYEYYYNCVREDCDDGFWIYGIKFELDRGDFVKYEF